MLGTLENYSQHLRLPVADIERLSMRSLSSLEDTEGAEGDRDYIACRSIVHLSPDLKNDFYDSLLRFVITEKSCIIRIMLQHLSADVLLNQVDLAGKQMKDWL